MQNPLDTNPAPSSLSPILKSSTFSLASHGLLIAALYVIPSATSKRFSQTGQTQFIAIEALHDKPSSATLVAVDPESTTIASELDSLVDRVVHTDRTKVLEFVDSLRRTDHSDSPKLQLPKSLPELFTDQKVMLKRRITDEPKPQVAIEKSPPRPKIPRRNAEPPTEATIPIEQFVGLEKEASVDLSANKPPDYPLEAVRRRLEGVVLLKLTINSSGAVVSVELIESSGYSILDRAAVKAVSTWRGTPAKRWGRAVESVERLPIRFRL